jgi:hypothetical protein
MPYHTRTCMSDEQQQQHRETPIFRLRRSYRSEPTLSAEIAREDEAISFPLGGVVGESRISVYGGIRPPNSPSHSVSFPLSLSHRRSAPTPLSSLQSIREDRSASPGPRMCFPPHQPPSLRGPSSSSSIREQSPQMTAGFVPTDGLSVHSPHASTSSVSVGITNPGEASPRDLFTSQHYVRGEDTRQEKGGTLSSLSSRRTAKKDSKRGGMEAHSVGKRKKNREASKKSLGNKKGTMAELKRRSEEMGANEERIWNAR